MFLEKKCLDYVSKVEHFSKSLKNKSINKIQIDIAKPAPFKIENRLSRINATGKRKRQREKREREGGNGSAQKGGDKNTVKRRAKE